MELRTGSLICVLVTCLLGCGGSGSGGAAKIAHTSITINWPAKGQGVSSAVSCQFALQPANFSASAIVFSGNRPADVAPINATYSASGAGQAGLWNLTANFYPSAGETGTPVGVATLQVMIQSNGSVTLPNGSPLKFSFTGAVATAQIEPGLLVMVGSSAPLAASAFDSNNDVVIVPPASFTFALSGNSSNLSVASNGEASGLAIGSALVTASIGNVNAPAQAVSVTPSFSTIAINAQDIAYDSSRDTLWVSEGFGQNLFQGALVPINATTGAVGAPITTIAYPTYLTVTGDSQYLYVANLSGALNRLVLATQSIDQTIQAPAGDQAIAVTAVPGTQNSVAVSYVVSASQGTDAGTYIYDVVTPRANSALLGESIAFNSAGSRVYGLQQYQYPGTLYATANIDSTGITGLSTSVNSLAGLGNRIHWNNGRVLDDQGTVVDPDSGSSLGQLAMTLIAPAVAPVPGTNFAYFVSAASGGIQEFDTGALTSMFSSPLGIYGQEVGKAIYLPGNRVAFITAESLLNQVYIVKRLPN